MNGLNSQKETWKYYFNRNSFYSIIFLCIFFNIISITITTDQLYRLPRFNRFNLFCCLFVNAVNAVNAVYAVCVVCVHGIHGIHNTTQHNSVRSVRLWQLSIKYTVIRSVMCGIMHTMYTYVYINISKVFNLPCSNRSNLWQQNRILIVTICNLNRIVEQVELRTFGEFWLMVFPTFYFHLYCNSCGL